MNGFTAWLVYARRPAELLDSIVITDKTGTTMASRPLAYGAARHHSWDTALRQLGYARASKWAEVSGGHVCDVEPA